MSRTTEEKKIVTLKTKVDVWNRWRKINKLMAGKK